MIACIDLRNEHVCTIYLLIASMIHLVRAFFSIPSTGDVNYSVFIKL